MKSIWLVMLFATVLLVPFVAGASVTASGTGQTAGAAVYSISAGTVFNAQSVVRAHSFVIAASMASPQSTAQKEKDEFKGKDKDRGKDKDKDKGRFHGAEMNTTAIAIAGILALAAYLLFVRRSSHGRA